MMQGRDGSETKVAEMGEVFRTTFSEAINVRIDGTASRGPGPILIALPWTGDGTSAALPVPQPQHPVGHDFRHCEPRALIGAGRANTERHVERS